MVNIIKDGDLFTVPADILINPVNRAGISGAGLAKAFKSRFPEYETYWRKETSFPMEKPLMVIRMCPPFDPSIIYFPTKHNPYDKYSNLQLIREGLDWLKGQLEYYQRSTINMPALGCGLGGLDFEGVIKPLILDMFQNEPYTINLFKPKSSKKHG